MVFETEYASERQLISWVLSWRENARLLDPPELAAEADERLALLRDRHRDGVRRREDGQPPARRGRDGRRNGGSRGSNGRSESVIRPERFARLVTLAGLLIGAAREEGSLPTKQVLDELNISLRGAARGPRRPQRRQLRRRHLRPLRRDRRRPDRGRPRHLRRQLRPPGAPAAARGEGAGRRDRPVRRPPAAVGPAERAQARSSRRSATTLGGGARDRPRPRRLLGRADRQRGDPAPPRARAPVLQGERGRLRQARGRALPAGQGPGGLVPRLLRPRPLRTRATSASTG